MGETNEATFDGMQFPVKTLTCKECGNDLQPGDSCDHFRYKEDGTLTLERLD